MEYVACNLCGSRNSGVLYPSTMPEGPTTGDIELFRCTSASYGQHHTIVKCRNCGLVYVNWNFDINSKARPQAAKNAPGDGC